MTVEASFSLSLEGEGQGEGEPPGHLPLTPTLSPFSGEREHDSRRFETQLRYISVASVVSFDSRRRAFRNTDSSIAGVSLPVFVFWRLGW